MKVVHPDGSVTYRYNRKKTKRVRRPSKKERQKSLKSMLERYGKRYFPYRIYFTSRKSMRRIVGYYKTLEEAEASKKVLLMENDAVEFPKESAVYGTESRSPVSLDYEYVMTKMMSAEWETPHTEVRNEYGKIKPVHVDSSKLKIIDVFPCVVEETFDVMGYDKRDDRKTYRWIYENLLDSREDVIRVCQYTNKVLFIDDEYEFEMVTCKNRRDAERLYRKLFIKYSDVKNEPHVFFTGSIEPHSARQKQLKEMIQKKCSQG